MIYKRIDIKFTVSHMQMGAGEEISKENSHFLCSTRGDGCFTFAMPYGDDAFLYHCINERTAISCIRFCSV